MGRYLLVRTPADVSTETSETKAEHVLATIKEDNHFGQEFENLLSEHMSREGEISPERELGLRTLYLSLRSEQMIPAGNA